MCNVHPNYVDKKCNFPGSYCYTARHCEQVHQIIITKSE